MEAEPTRLLLVEDDQDFAGLLTHVLSGSREHPFNILHAGRLQEALDVLTKQLVDIVLLDLGLPDGHGLETFLRVNAHAPHIPIVILTALDNDAVANEAVARGAQDYLVKGEAATKLLPRVLRYAIERKRAEEALREKASLEAMNRIMMNREERILELKQEIDALLREFGRPAKYNVESRPH